MVHLNTERSSRAPTKVLKLAVSAVKYLSSGWLSMEDKVAGWASHISDSEVLTPYWWRRPMEHSSSPSTSRPLMEILERRRRLEHVRS